MFRAIRVETLFPLIPLLVATAAVGAGRESNGDRLRADAQAVLKNRCVQCHGPAKVEGGLNLAIPQGIARGGKSGRALVAGKPEASALWRRVASNQMPPGEPLGETDKAALKRWIEAGAPGVPTVAPPKPQTDEHWSFQPLRTPPVPQFRNPQSAIRNPIDAFIRQKLQANGLTMAPEADRPTLIRRVAFDLTGLPPTPAEVEAFLKDGTAGAYERMVDRYLASPRYGERWGKHWLDAAGYADSNGYFSADTDRPLAYRYRDYVIRSINADKPWDQFLREQLAGDELASYGPGRDITAEMVELLEATHFLRNSPDGTDSSDGNPDEVKADKYAVLEGQIQIIGASLFGVTTQCARCHDHKFEPFKQRDYYSLQAILYPAFNVANWVTPTKREMTAATAAEMAAWQERTKEIDVQITSLRWEFVEWAKENRERGRVVFSDAFDTAEGRLAERWSNTVPGDASPAGTPAVQVDSPAAPGAQIVKGSLRIRESGSAGDRVLSTRETFDWAPTAKGSWVQATFDLLREGHAAPYVGYFLALNDFHEAGASRGQPASGGNILLDGNGEGKAAVHIRYPGPRSTGRGSIGRSGYKPGRNYGVRITNIGDGKFELAQVVDGVPEEGVVTMTASDLPRGAFGFEYCCGRSFTVDNVLIETGESDPSDPGAKALAAARSRKRSELEAAVKALEAQRPPRPGLLAAVTDLSAEPPKVPLLERGEYKLPKDPVPPAAPGVLSDPTNPAAPTAKPLEAKHTTGSRLAFAQWLTKPGSRAAALLARVTVNRWWSHHFGTGLVDTPENLGYSGATPSHPELLEYLAARLVSNGWRGKPLHREIILSATYRQAAVASGQWSVVGGQQSAVSSRQSAVSSQQSAVGGQRSAVSDQRPISDSIRGPSVTSVSVRVKNPQSVDPENRLLWRFPLRRLDAESIRDGMLAISGELDTAGGGPYVPTTRDGEGDVVIADGAAGGLRRSLYLQQRRTQITGLLDVFDAPSIVASCTARPSTTVPLQSLKLLNSAFIRQRATAFAKRLSSQAGQDQGARIRLAFTLVKSRGPTTAESGASEKFLTGQLAEYPGQADADERAWIDFCQMLLASNSFLYVE